MPSSPNIKTTFKKNGVTVHIGKNYGGLKSSQSAAAEAIADELEKTLKDASRGRFFQFRADHLAQKISLEIDKELRRVGTFIGAHMIGRTSPRSAGETTFELSDESDPDGLREIEVTWRNLSLSTLRKKSRNKNRFFLHETDLKQDIRANAGSNLARMANAGRKRRTRKGEVVYGPVRITPVYAAGGSKLYQIGNIEIDLFKGSRLDKLQPLLNETIFPKAGNITDVKYLGRALGLSSDSIQKLVGAHGREQSVAYRPLLEPAVAYFLLNRVPGAVDRVLRRYANRGI